MAAREIVLEGDPVLRLKAKGVRRFGQRVTDLVADMFETLHAANGVGLAAPQIGISERIVVIEIPEDSEDEPNAGAKIAIINPEILKAKGEDVCSEGCLSVPGFSGDVARAEQVLVKGKDPEGRDIRHKASGLLARAFQHEIDHLDGILFLDRVEEGTLVYHGEQELPDLTPER
ncbi:MAG: peptide deformylase [Anaerolineae bacterium]